MDNDRLLLGRIRDLARRTSEQNYITHTDFLSRSELSEAMSACAANGLITGTDQIDFVTFVKYGGTPDSDRAMICFLPSYLDKESFLRQADEEGVILCCIRIEPVNKRFADELTHRDYLGALMNLGIERNRIGDILTDSSKAYIFVTTDVADLICDELIRIRHTTVKCTRVPPQSCDITPSFKEIEGTVSSERLDAILALVYKLSRGKAQELIESEAVSVDGKISFSGGYDLKAGSVVSVRGHGKFIYLGTEKSTRKGRLLVKIKLYA
ncbi:MAG: RNA-binding protein [Butyrivibrio sp.]|nr:RNA-binding protein [Butyrivibrio sp.]